MERGLALALFILISLGIMTVKVLHKSGVMDAKTDWHQYLAEHTTLWLMLVPFFYAALCEVARGREVPKLILTLTRGIGIILVTVSALLLFFLVF